MATSWHLYRNTTEEDTDPLSGLFGWVDVTGYCDGPVNTSIPFNCTAENDGVDSEFVVDIEVNLPEDFGYHTYLRVSATATFGSGDILYIQGGDILCENLNYYAPFVMGCNVASPDVVETSLSPLLVGVYALNFSSAYALEYPCEGTVTFTKIEVYRIPPGYWVSVLSEFSPKWRDYEDLYPIEYREPPGDKVPYWYDEEWRYLGGENSEAAFLLLDSQELTDDVTNSPLIRVTGNEYVVVDVDQITNIPAQPTPLYMTSPTTLSASGPNNPFVAFTFPLGVVDEGGNHITEIEYYVPEYIPPL